MIDVKQAVRSAEDYARELFDEADLRHLRLEEVEMSEDGRQWKVTLGWVEPAVAKPGLMINGTLRRLPRVYKLFEVDAETGTVSAMKIRELN
ncbi:MAG TPA: hypothetical protein VF092_06050 [Longimicrobium sp.]